MLAPSEIPISESRRRLNWLMFLRVVFTTLLLGSTIVLNIRESASLMTGPLMALYGMIAGIFLLSFLYALIIRIVSNYTLFTFLQIVIDTFAVSLIIFITGGFISVFSFLYLVVIIYASMLLYRRGSLVMAWLCSFQYTLMVHLQYIEFLTPFGFEAQPLTRSFSTGFIVYRILITIAACFAVAFLSGFLSEQARQTRKELKAMEDHVKRVERMAAIGEMAAGLAHEIKNPLASLAGSIQLMREDPNQDPGQRKLMQIILREADRLSSLVTNFLFFARPTAGKKQSIDLEKTMREILTLFSQDAICKGRIEVEVNLVSGVFIEMDPDHLYQVLWNLLINAAQAIQGQGNIDVRMYPVKGGQAVVKITDDGSGIPDDTLKMIFDPFFTTKSKGTGLGLSIVYRILEAYGSRLDVESQPGLGTTFTLRFQRLSGPNKT